MSAALQIAGIPLYDRLCSGSSQRLSCTVVLTVCSREYRNKYGRLSRSCVSQICTSFVRPEQTLCRSSSSVALPSDLVANTLSSVLLPCFLWASCQGDLLYLRSPESGSSVTVTDDRRNQCLSVHPDLSAGTSAIRISPKCRSRTTSSCLERDGSTVHTHACLPNAILANDGRHDSVSDPSAYAAT